MQPALLQDSAHLGHQLNAAAADMLQLAITGKQQQLATLTRCMRLPLCISWSMMASAYLQDRLHHSYSAALHTGV